MEKLIMKDLGSDRMGDRDNKDKTSVDKQMKDTDWDLTHDTHELDV